MKEEPKIHETSHKKIKFKPMSIKLIWKWSENSQSWSLKRRIDWSESDDYSSSIDQNSTFKRNRQLKYALSSQEGNKPSKQEIEESWNLDWILEEHTSEGQETLKNNFLYSSASPQNVKLYMFYNNAHIPGQKKPE